MAVLPPFLTSSPSIWNPRATPPLPEPDLDRPEPVRPVDPRESMAVLKALSNNDEYSGPNAAIELRGLRQDRQSELEGRMAAAGGPRNPEAGRYAELLRTLGRDIDQDPFTGTEAMGRAQAEEDRRLALKNWMDPQEKMKRSADQNFQLRKILSAHQPQPGKADMFGRVIQSPGLAPNADPEAPIQMTGGGRGRGGGTFGVRGSTEGFEGESDMDPWLDANGRPITPTSTAQDPEVRGRELTADLPPVIADMAIGLADYSIELPKGTALTKPEWQMAISRAKAIDPNWSQAEYTKRAQAIKAFGSGGNERENIDNINTVLQHIKALKEVADNLHNYGPFPGSNIVNSVVNNAKGMSGDPAIADFDLVSNVATGDIAKAFQKGAVPLEIVNRWHELVTKAKSQGQYDVTIKRMIDVLSDRIGQKQRAYEESTGKPYAAIRQQFLSPENQAFIKELSPRGDIYNPQRNLPGVQNAPEEAGMGADTGRGPLPPSRDGRPRRRVKGGGIAVQGEDGQWYPE